MKKTMACLMSIALLLCGLHNSETVYADYWDDSRVHYVADGIEVKELSNWGDELVIPEEYAGLPVKRIAQRAYQNDGKIKILQIDDGVEQIGHEAFANSSVEAITLGKTVTSVGEGAFYNTPFYNNIQNWTGNGGLYIGDCLLRVSPAVSGKFKVQPGTRVIASKAFENCSNITEVELPPTVKYIGEKAFEGCGVWNNNDYWVDGVLYLNDILVSAYGAKGEVAVREGTVAIAEGAFGAANNVTKIVLPETMDWIGKNGFASCWSVEEIVISQSVSYIGDYAFSDCPSLRTITIDEKNPNYLVEDGVVYNSSKDTVVGCTQKERVVLEDGVKFIGAGAFLCCKQLTEIQLPKTLEVIDHQAFSCCEKLKSIALPKNLVSIGRYAFENCELLEQVHIGDKIEVISEGAFARCKNLAAITLPANLKEIEKNAFLHTALWEEEGNYDEKGCLIVNNWLLRVRSGESDIYEVPEGVVSIAAGAFKECVNVTELHYPNTLSYVSKEAFPEDAYISCVVYDGTEKEWQEASPTLRYVGDEYVENVNLKPDVPILKMSILLIICVVPFVMMLLSYKRAKNKRIHKKE